MVPLRLLAAFGENANCKNQVLGHCTLHGLPEYTGSASRCRSPDLESGLRYEGRTARCSRGTRFAKDEPVTNQTVQNIMNIMKMNMTKTNRWLAGAAAILTATAVFGDAPNQPATAVSAEKSYTGTVISVDPKERTLSVREWALSKKTFNLGDNCTYALLFTTVEHNHGTAKDLRAGEKVTVRYQNSQSVLIADRIEQQPVRFEGMVAAINPDQHTLIVHRRGLDKELALPDDCLVLLRNEKPGQLADIHAGDHVTVTYEKPGGTPTAREIAQTSLDFTGTLTAIDLGEKTVKAKAMFDTKKFSVADNCAIVINGKPDGKLSDLKPNDKLLFSYDEINGVNVLNRIGPAPVQVQSKTDMMTTTPGYSGYPTMGY